MPKILLVSDDENQNKLITHSLSKTSTAVIASTDEAAILNYAEKGLISLIIIDEGLKNLDAVILCKKLQAFNIRENITIISLVAQDTDNVELLKLTNANITKPVNDKVLIASINTNLKLKKAIDTLSTNNSELAKSLYQLDVLYNTSTQLAGSLDKQKLIKIMIDGLEKSLSFSLSSTLVFNDEHDIDLIINSLYAISPRLEHSLKLRAILSYRALFDKKRIPYDININDIKVTKHIKHPLEEYDLNILKFDNLFAPINVGEKFFGLIEVFREADFTQEDTTCFQTLARQVSLPLENASLYEEIKKANIKLEKLERLKSEFISIVSHELRTPLTAIKNSLEICLSGKAGDVSSIMDKFLNMAQRNVTRLSGIINDLLDLSKVEAGKMDFKFEKANINIPVEFIKNTFENVAKDKNITLILEKDDDVFQTYYDNQRIEQVMSNLVSNAIKFTNENGKITIKTENISLKDIDRTKLAGIENAAFYENYIKVSVKDSGIGIAPEDQKKVFDQFQQIENSLNRKNGGTGLGLPIAKQLIEAHKGFIWVESELNRGTTFSFVIPVLSEKEKFIIDLDKEIAKAKACSQSLLLLLVKEDRGRIPSFISEIKEGKISIIRKTANTKEAYFTGNGANFFAVMIPEADKFAQSFIEKKIESTINPDNERHTDSKYDILYSSATYPEGGADAKELFEFVETALSKGISQNDLSEV